MFVCKTCNIPMVKVLSFSKDKHERYCRCPKCMEETKHQKVRDTEFTFGEILNRACKYINN